MFALVIENLNAPYFCRTGIQHGQMLWMTEVVPEEVSAVSPRAAAAAPSPTRAPRGTVPICKTQFEIDLLFLFKRVST